MLVVLVMIAAVLIPVILFFFTPNPAPQQVNNVAENSTRSGSNRANTPAAGNPIDGSSAKSGTKNEMPTAEIVSLKTRLHINKVDATITLSLHKDFTTGKIASEYDGLEKVLSTLSSVGDVFVLVHCDNDEDEKEEQQIRQVLGEKAAYFQAYPHRVLFCASHIGKVAFLRQLKPYLHLEFDPKVYEDLRPHIPVIVLHRLNSDSQLQSLYQQHSRPYPNLIQNQISNILTLQVKI